MRTLPVGDGNGWVDCACGRRHWGLHGAAGLLVVHDGEAGPCVLLQLRASWTHNGGTWALPGGARDSHESAREAALREATEETSLDPATVDVRDQLVDDHETWSYTTVIASAGRTVTVDSINNESDAMRWWPVADVAALPLHYGFAASWPALHDRITHGITHGTRDNVTPGDQPDVS